MKDDRPVGDEDDAVVHGSKDDPYGVPETVLGLIKEIQDENSHLSEFHQRAQMNERFILGSQTWDNIVPNDTNVSFWGRRSPSRNYMRNLAKTWTSRVLEDYPSVTAYPADASAGDRAAADVCNDILDYSYEVNEFDALFARAALLAQAHSCVGFKIMWNENGGPRNRVPVIDEVSGLPMFNSLEDDDPQPQFDEIMAGDVKVELVTIFDYYTDGSQFIEDSEYVAFRKSISRWRAEAMIRKEKPGHLEEGERLPETENVSIWDEKSKGVEVWEIYFRPGGRFEEGLYATTVGGVVLENRPFPYQHGELPLAVWKVGDRRGHPYGSTHIDDAVEIQGLINAKVELQLRMYEVWAKSMKLAANRQVADAWSDENEVIIVDDPAVLQYIRWLDPPMEKVAKYTEDIEMEVRRLYDIFGLEPQGPQAASTSGRAMAYRKETEGAKLSESSRNLGACVKRVFRQVLKLTQQYAEMERTIAVTGPDGVLRAQSFKKADISGWDVRLQNTSGLGRFRDVKVDEQRGLAAASGLPPNMVDEAGLDGEKTDMFDRRAVQEQIKALMEGQPVEPDQSISPRVGVEEVSLILEQQGHAMPPNIAQAMQMLLAQYRQQMAAGQGGQGAGLSSRGAALDQQDPNKTTAGMSRGVQGGAVPR